MKNNYRPDIQGLRAVAVLLVFFSHAHWPLFSGGFVGVDVFFTISGYVITQLLLTEYHNRHTISLLRFYARRLQRLLPALVFMIIVSCLVSFIILTPAEQLFQYHSAISASLWLSNIFLLVADIDYFGHEAKDNLFLHTWSLGIEEQFYLIWPIILLAGLGYFSRNKSISSRLVPVLILAVIISLALNFFLSVTSMKFAFYLMPARIWQFSLGALVAYLHMHHSGQKFFGTYGISREILALSGVALGFVSASWFDMSTPYPHWQVIIPTAGTALILFSYRYSQPSMVGRVLSLQPLRWMGDISYSFYLWHWPVLLFCERLKPFYPGVNTQLALIITLVISTISWYFVENPIRRNQQLLATPKRTVWGALSFMLLVCITLLSFKTVSTRFYNDPEQLQIITVKQKVPIIYEYGCDDWYHSARVNTCVFGKNPEKIAVLMGDSVVMQWFPVLADYFVSHGWQLVVLTKSSCPMVNRSHYSKRIKSIYHVCDIWRSAAINHIAQMQPQMVILGSATSYSFSRAEWQDGTRDILEQLQPFVGKISIIAGTPQLGFDGPQCLARRAWLANLLPRKSESVCSRKLQPDKSWKWLEEVAATMPEVDFLEFSNAICPDGVCTAKINDTIVFRDNQHLSTDFVFSFRDVFAEKIPIN